MVALCDSKYGSDGKTQGRRRGAMHGVNNISHRKMSLMASKNTEGASYKVLKRRRGSELLTSANDNE